MKAMFIAAHPDDIEFGCAGTISKLEKNKVEIIWVLLTRGENDIKHSGEIRIKEMEESADILNVKKVYFLDLLDGEVKDDRVTIDRISEVISEVNPDIVFTHYPDDRHQDHRNAAYSVRAACWGKCNLFYFNSFSSIGFTPNLFVDITNEDDVKKKALMCYKSQIDKFTDRDIDFIGVSSANDRKNGGDIHSVSAEGFQVVNCVWNI